jgi:predicted FMN-binding regulatory protein PaiB
MENEINELADSLEAELNPNMMSEEELQGIVGKEIERNRLC